MLCDLFGDNEVEIVSESNGGRALGPSNTQLPRPKPCRSSCGFVGLDNQGATCYLNSLIQALYMTTELRDGLFAIDPKSLNADQVEEYQDGFVKGKKTSKDETEIEPDENLLSNLTEFGFDIASSRIALVAVKNSGCEAAIDWMDRHPDQLAEALTIAAASGANSAAESKRRKKPRLIPLELQRLFTQLLLLDQRSISTEDLTNRGFSWQNMEGRVQHDAHELNRLLVDAIEKSFKHTPHEDFCKQLYQGTLAYQTTCQSCVTLSQRQEQFYDLNLQVLGLPDVAAALRNYTMAEILEGDSAYACDVCGTKTRAFRAAVLTKLPPILTLSCNRFKCDRSTNWQREKILDAYAFPILLDMNVYVDGSVLAGAVPCVDATSEAMLLDEARSRHVWLDDVTQSASVIAAELMEAYGESVTLDQLSATEMIAIGRRMNSASEFGRSTDNGVLENKYQLFAVIIHRGSAYAGHYFAYIRDTRGEGNHFLSDEALNSSFVTAATAGSNVQYVVAKNGNFEIAEGSALAILLNAFLSSSEGDHETSSNSSSQQASSSTNIKVTASKALSVHTIGRLMKAALGQTWQSKYKDSIGTLNEFVLRHSSLFTVDGNSVTLLGGRRLEIISLEEFQALVSIMQTTGPQVGPTDEIASQIDTDEALARALSDEILQDSISVPAKSEVIAPKGDTTWEPAKKKRGRPKVAVAIKPILNKKGPKQNAKPLPTDSVDKAAKEVDTKETLAIETEPTPMVVDEAANQRAAKLRRLADDLCGRFHGYYYEFNDADVKAMPFADLGKAIAGSNTAYLLIYRRMQSSGDVAPASEGNASILVSDIVIEIDGKKPEANSQSRKRQKKGKAVSKPSSTDEVAKAIDHKVESARPRQSPPEFWMTKVKSMNDSISAARLAFENQSNLTTIRIYCPKHISLNGALLVPTAIPAELLKAPTSSAVLATGFLDIEINVQNSVKEVIGNILSTYRHLLVALGLELASVDSLVLSELASFGPGFHPKEAIALSQSGSEAIVRGGVYLLWNGNDIHGIRIKAGFENAPTRLTLTYLIPATMSQDANGTSNTPTKQVVRRGKTTSIPIVDTSSSVDFWANKSSTVAELCREAGQLFGINESNLVVHLVDKQMGPVKSASSNNDGLPVAGMSRAAANKLRASVRSNGNPRELTAVLLWCAGSTVKFNQSSSQNSNLSRSVQATAATMSVGDMVSDSVGYFYGSEILVEDIESKGMCSLALADAEILRRNSTWTITVEFTFDVQTWAASMQPAIAGNGDAAAEIQMPVMDLTDDSLAKGYELSATGYIQLKLQVEKDCSASLLKLLVFQRLGLPSCLGHEVFERNTRVRLGGELVEIETFPISDLGAKDDCVIYMERGRLAAGSNTIIRARLSQPQAKPADSQAVVDVDTVSTGLEPIEIELPLQMTVRQLRDLLGVRLAGLTEGWTEAQADTTFSSFIDDGEVDSGCYRLRRTNWQEESEDIISELNDKGAALTLETTHLNNNHIILLEPGALPVKGRSTFKVFVWKQEGSVAAPSNEQLDDWTRRANAANKMIIDLLHSGTCFPDDNALADLELYNEIKKWKASFFVTAGIVKVHESKPLSELQSIVHELLTREYKKQAEQQVPHSFDLPESVDHFVLREARPDFLPGKCYWTCAVPGGIGSATDDLIASIGKGGASGSGGSSGVVTNSTASSILKKLNLVGERVLIVELLGRKQAEVRPKLGGFRIFVSRWLNPYANPSEGVAETLPIWPPLQTTVDGGAAPSFGHLLQALRSSAAQLGITPAPDSIAETLKLTVFKFQHNTHNWLRIEAGMKPNVVGQNATQKGKAKARATVKLDNITLKPFDFKEGDCVCICDEQEYNSARLLACSGSTQMCEVASSTSASDSLTTSAEVSAAATNGPLDLAAAPFISISRAEDVLFQILAVHRKRSKKYGGNQGSSDTIKSSTSGRARARAVETALTIGGDLNFSDDEENDEDETIVVAL